MKRQYKKRFEAKYPEALEFMAGERRFERPTGGFGDRCSTN